jgi:hypothetical protein
MIDEDDDELWGYKQACHYDLLSHHFSFDEEDFEVYQFCMRDDANSDPFIRESMGRYIVDLINKYPGLVPITEEKAIENKIPLEAAKIAGLGLPEDEIRRNVYKFALWVSFEELKRLPGCVFRQREAFKLIFRYKEYGVSCEPEDLIFLLQCIGPPDISPIERDRMQAHSVIDKAMKMNGWSHEIAANEWWECLHDKPVSELNEFERKCRVRDARGAFDMLRTDKNRITKKRKELVGKMRKL